MTSTFASLEVRFSRTDEFLNELALAVKDEAVDYNIVRLAVVSQQGTKGDLNPNLFGTPDGNKPLHPTIKAHWLEAGYTSRGQMVKLSALLGLVKDGAVPNETEPSIEAWRTKNRETSERELELVRQLEAGIKAHGRLEIRTGGLHGEDPGWRAHEDIAAVAQAQLCITCIQPIHFSNGQWRHDSDGRAELYDEASCPKCKGSRAVPSRDYPGEYDRCRDCTTTPGVKLTLNHLADPEQEGRKV